MGESSVFIGSSNENHHLTEQLSKWLEAAGVDVVPWYDAFDAGFAALEELTKRIVEVDFAAFFLVADDEVTSRDQERTTPRDNIVFELGLFMGHLNRDRTFALVDPSNPPDLPSDFAGVTYIRFDPEDIRALATDLSDRIRRLGGLARIPHGTHVVARGATGRYSYDTISSAVQVAEPGDVILVQPGVYHEPLIIDKPLEIIGVGATPDETAVVRADGETAITYCAPGRSGRIATLTIEACGEGNSVVDVIDGKLLLRGCTITARNDIDACVRVRRDGSASIDWNDISGSEGVGVLVCESGAAEIRDNLIQKHAHTCVEIRDGVQVVTVEDNRIGHGRAGGIWFHGGSRGLVTRNEIYNNKLAGISVTDGADPEITGNHIHGGFWDGVSIGSDGRGQILDNDIYANAGTGVSIEGGGEPLVENNRIYDGRGGGIAVQRGAKPRITQNLVRANKQAGVAIMAGAEVHAFSGNTIIDGNDAGVYDEVGIPELDNQVLRNAREDWVRAPDAAHSLS